MVIMMDNTTLTKAAMELEELRLAEEQSSHSKDGTVLRNALNIRFPSNCLQLLYNIPGNTRCVDCGASNPQWATLSYGALLCIDCSGRHRQMGVHVSVVRSITMDAWKHTEILSMLEGGNKQLGDFFDRHDLPSSLETSASNSSSNNNSAPPINRYKTNAAKFYKKNLLLHVTQVKDSGIYKGRDVFRKSPPQKKKRRYGVEGENNNTGNTCQSQHQPICAHNNENKESVEAKA